MMMLREHDMVVLNRNVPDHNLRSGDVGAIIHVYDGGKAYEVEFVTGSGETVAVETLEPKDIRPLGKSEILHIRSIAAA